MRRFLLILLALLLALPALAEEAPVFSSDALLLKAANEALAARYGLTPHLLGLFDTELTRYGDVATVRLLPRARPHPRLAGEYLVLISPDNVQAFWSHDDVDPAIWQSGELNSVAWGAPQLLKYLEAGSFHREYFDAPYITDPATPVNAVAILESGCMNRELRRGDLTEAECTPWIALGRTAAQAMYDLSDADAAALSLVNVTLYLPLNGAPMWHIYFYQVGDPDEINYSVCLDGSTMELLYTSVFTGGIG